MSEIKVNKISPKQTCTQVTLGDSGDTFTIPAGVTLTNNGTATGFGPTGAVSWNTTKITADPNPAVSGVGYFADTSSAAFTVTLPAAPSAGDIVAIADYNGTARTNNITVGRNSSNINGSATDLTINANYSAITLVYVDATAGWRLVDTFNQPEYVAATGGTITCCGDYKIHSFTGPGTFTVTNAGNLIGSSTVDYLVVAGGGGGAAGAGGAGGYRESSGAASGCYSVSPLGSGVSALPVITQAYPITVGGGGAGNTGPGGPGAVNGNPSVFSTITSTGGGRTLETGPGSFNGAPGGSGGSGFSSTGSAGTAGAGNTPPVSPPQGNPGGTPGPSNSSGGGGGATTAGTPGPSGGSGGVGATSSINGTPTGRAGGGVGFPGSGTAVDGGGDGGNTPTGATAGTVNTGGGGGGGNAFNGAAGGSGIVIIRYKFQ
jgi:hypothetical protein